MIRLDTTTRKLSIKLGGAITSNQLTVTVCYSDKTATTYNGATQLTITNNTTTVDICDAPASSTIRDIDYISIRNADTVAATVTVIYDDNATLSSEIIVTLQAKDKLTYTHGSGWETIDSTGATKVVVPFAGTVTTISVATANGFTGSSDGDPVAPELTLGTNLTGILKGDGTAMSAVTAPSGTIVGTSDTQTLTNKRITKRVLSLSANSATPAINTDLYDVVHITAQTAAITSFTSSLSGTPVDGDTLRISVTGTGAVALTFGSSFEASGGVPLSTTTIGTARLDMGFFWNTETSKWRCTATA